jgi:hypothetical protein
MTACFRGHEENEQKKEIDIQHMTGNGIRVHKIKESLAALHIQRRHNVDKDDMSTH